MEKLKVFTFLNCIDGTRSRKSITNKTKQGLNLRVDFAIVKPQMPSGNKRSYILKQTYSF